MIFGEGFDKSLWLMLAGDKENRAKLAYFIRTMPKHIYNEILQEIRNKNYGMEKASYAYPIIGEKSIDDGFDYFYKYRFVGDKLELYLSRCNVDFNLVETFTLNLNIFDFEELMYVDFIDGIHLGSFEWSVDKLNYNASSLAESRQSSNSKYKVYRDVFDNLIIGNGKTRKIVNYVSKCPEEMYLVDFSTDKKVNGLVRKRKRWKKGTSIGEKNGF